MPVAEASGSVLQAIAEAARRASLSTPKTLSPWLFYDSRGSELFEQITTLPEYYLTRTERSILAAHAAEILAAAAGENHALTLARTRCRHRHQDRHPPPRPPSAGREASSTSPSTSAPPPSTKPPATSRPIIPGLTVRPQVANYTAEPISLTRPRVGSEDARVLALYIGSSIGNFSPAESLDLLRNLRRQLRPADSLLLGADLAPGPHKSVATLVSAYDDAAGVTAAFNRNILTRLNRDLAADFNLACFAHRARWNASLSRMEMHLEALTSQHIHIPANTAGPAISFTLEASQTIHTENSYKFTPASVSDLLSSAGFHVTRTWQDPQALFAVTLATAT